MLHNTISKKVSRDTNQQNSEHQGLLKSDVDDTASVACRLRNQKLLLRLLFSLSFFFFFLLLMFFKGMIVKFLKSGPAMRGLWIPSKSFILFSKWARLSLLGLGGCMNNWRMFILLICILYDDVLKIQAIVTLRPYVHYAMGQMTCMV